MNITQDMYDVLLQSQRILHIKVNLLNFQFITVNELSGVVIENPKFTIDANSDIRRTCNISMVVDDDLYDLDSGGQIWIDKYVQVYVGIENIHTDEIVWFNQGIYLINTPSVSYNDETNLLSFQGVDLMAKFTGMRNGYLEGMTYTIPQGSVIRNVLIDALALMGFKNYIITPKEGQELTPYEIQLDVGASIYDIFTKIRDIYNNYQIYFDVDGVFHYELFPIDANNPVIVDNSMWDELYLSYESTPDFEKVKNVIEVIGKSYDVSHYASTVTVSGSQYSTDIASVTSLYNGLMVGLRFPAIRSTPSLRINSLTRCSIVNEDGTPTVIPEINTYYVIMYKDGQFIFMGSQQIRAIAKDTNPESPFYVEGSTGEIRIVLSGGDYDIIPTLQLAQDRADYELYLRARMNDSLTIETVPIYFIEAYQLIEFTFPMDGITRKYLIQSVSTGDTQTITCSRFYPLYPFS